MGAEISTGKSWIESLVRGAICPLKGFCGIGNEVRFNSWAAQTGLADSIGQTRISVHMIASSLQQLIISPTVLDCFFIRQIFAVQR